MPIDQYTLNYLNHLQSAVQSLHERLYEVEHRIGELQADVEKLKKDPKTHVGTIEYKFDQLKIETLEGTLNIGLTPSGDGLDELDVGDQQIKVPKTKTHRSEEEETELTPLEQEVKQRIDAYLQSNAINDIQQIEVQHNFPLNEQYRLFIIEDIHKQIPNRIRELYAALHEEPKTRNLSKNDPDQAEQLLFDNLHRDILNGIEKFITNLKSGSDAT